MVGGSRTIEQTLHVAPVVSSMMENAIQEWVALYKGEAEWIKEPTTDDPTRVVSLGLPALIASEKARTCLLEMESEITTPTEEQTKANPNYKEPEPDIFGNIVPSTEPKEITVDVPKTNVARAEYLNEQYKKLKKKLRTNMEYAIALGGLVIKPYLVFNKADDAEATADIEFDFILADSFYPLAFDSSGRITEAAFVQTKSDKDVVYRRLEYHKWENNKVQIQNRAFKSTNAPNSGHTGLDLGHEIPLSEVPEWKDLPEKTTIKSVSKPLFAYFKMPLANTIDMYSPLGVSGFARAKQLIKDADMQYSRLLWEYEGGELAIDVDRDALNIYQGSDGKMYSKASTLQERLFRKVDIEQTGETYYPYAPSLRDASYTNGLNTILMRIEDVCAISRGTLSDAATEAKTATELKILKQRSYQANADIQQALEDTLRDVIYIMNVYCDLYDITPDGDYDVNFEWDDSIIVDVDAELSKRITLQQNGLASKVETRMWYFGETERQAQEALRKVQEENTQAMEQNLMEQANMANISAQEREVGKQ